MGSIVSIAALAAAAVVTGGCAAQKTSAPESAALETARPLLTPASLGAVRSAHQRLRAMVGDREVVLECIVDVSAERVTVVGLLPAGTRLFSLRFDGIHMEQERAPQVPEQLKPEQLLADVQLALWPLDSLRSAFRNTPWSVTEPQAQTRRLLHNGRLAAEVHYAGNDPWRGKLWLVNFEQDYALFVDSVTLEQDT